MKKFLTFILSVSVFLILVAACGSSSQKVGTSLGDNIRYMHDGTRMVGCWYLSDTTGVAISCIPDVQYK